mgnify:CR=1 FL=1
MAVGSALVAVAVAVTPNLHQPFGYFCTNVELPEGLYKTVPFSGSKVIIWKVVNPVLKNKILKYQLENIKLKKSKI